MFDSLRGCQFAVEVHRDVQPRGKRQAAGANSASATGYALQALRAERRIRKPEVDRAIRSWGTSHGSLTQRDRDPPFKRSDPGAIPGRPTKFARHAQKAVRPPCKREKWGASPQSGSKARRVKQAGSCTRLLTDGCCQDGMAFEWSALRQVQRLACGVRSRREHDHDPL